MLRHRFIGAFLQRKCVRVLVDEDMFNLHDNFQTKMNHRNQVFVAISLETTTPASMQEQSFRQSNAISFLHTDRNMANSITTETSQSE